MTKWTSKSHDLSYTACWTLWRHFLWWALTFQMKHIIVVFIRFNSLLKNIVIFLFWNIIVALIVAVYLFQRVFEIFFSLGFAHRLACLFSIEIFYNRLLHNYFFIRRVILSTHFRYIVFILHHFMCCGKSPWNILGM